MTQEELFELVEREFARLAQGLEGWPDPHPDRQPDDSEYSRVTDAKRYRIVGARADAWAAGVVQLGLAVTHDRVEWADPPQTHLRQAYVLAPKATGALPLVIARHQLGDCEDAGLTLGAGSPTVVIDFVPDCGCDACDSGSGDLLATVDRCFSAVITGRYRRLSKGDRVITDDGDSRSTSYIDWRRSDAVLAHPKGWDELSGSSWFIPALRHPR
jgi:Family of unknown function (DUF6226)